MASEEKGVMSVSEAGRRGGAKTAETHGHEFYEEIGHPQGCPTCRRMSVLLTIQE